MPGKTEHTPCIRCVQGVFFMCRQNQALGLAVIAFSAGLLLGSMCEMSFGVFLLGMGGVCLGLTLLKKK